MKIIYKGSEIEVDWINSDPEDEDMPICVLFPKGHPLHAPDGVWLQCNDFLLVETMEATT